MASTDATAIPVKNQAYRVTFPIWDADGDLVTGATGLDSEVSKDGGTFADCTSEATEIATSSGMYYLDLTATEMNADTVAVIVKTSSSGAKTTPMIFYPQEAGDIKVNVTYWNGTAVASPATAGIPDVNIKNIDNDAASASGTVTFPNATLASTTNITAGTITTATNLTNNNDKTGYALSSAGIQAIWDAVTSALTTVGSIGKLLVDNIDATISSRLPTSSYTAPLSAAGVRTAVGLASANLDTQLSTIDDFLDTEVAAIKAKTDLIPAAPAAVGDIPTAAQNAAGLLDLAAGVETGLTVRQAFRLMAAALAGKLSGAATNTVTIRNAIADNKDRIVATVDADGNRTAVSTDVS